MQPSQRIAALQASWTMAAWLLRGVLQARGAAQPQPLRRLPLRLSILPSSAALYGTSALVCGATTAAAAAVAAVAGCGRGCGASSRSGSNSGRR